MPARLSQFAELCQRLAETGSKLEKRALMAEYLRALSVPEAGLAALYLAGVPFPETDGRELNVGGALLSRVLAQLSGANQATMHAAYLRHGDLGGAAQDLLPARSDAGHWCCPRWLLPLQRSANVSKAGRETANHAKPAPEGYPARSQVPDQDHPRRHAYRN